MKTHAVSLLQAATSSAAAPAAGTRPQAPAAATAAAGKRLPGSARLLLRLLESIDYGRLRLTLPDGSQREYGSAGRLVSIRLADLDVFGQIRRHGDIGLAETYLDGRWETDDLAALLDLLVANRRALEQAVYGKWWGNAWHRLRHLMNRNSRAGSRRNIHAHYDLGNPFYELWLDRTMTYSSALFDRSAGQPVGEQSLADAQTAKYNRLLDQLALPAGSKVLEIGCGWGGFAELAAQRGLQVTGLTLSTEQQAFANRRLARQRLDDRASAVLRDYRDETGQYNGIVSIEMFEAVGEAYWPAYFATLSRCLVPGGRAAIQTITIDDALFERYRRSTDFIQQYVFPGGMLPSPSRFRAMAAAAGLQVVDQLAFGADYAETLRRWREAFVAKVAQVRDQGFDARFEKLWLFYLGYCEAAFNHQSTDVMQFTLMRPVHGAGKPG